jgi:predicted ATPase/DNA-binding SARP family transcriptional activator
MRLDVLGPVRVLGDNGESATLLPKERALLAALALAAPRPASRAALESALWGDHVPRTATTTLRSHVSRLRAVLGSGTVVSSPQGYRLTVSPSCIDAVRLRSLVAEGRRAAGNADPLAARAAFAAAESLWRGQPLSDAAETPELEASRRTLTDLVAEAREGRLRAEIDLGRHSHVIDELERLVLDEPPREPLWGLLMLALYRSGRQLDALRTYERLRALLADEWGLDPAPDVQRLQWQILRQDPQLEAEPPKPPLAVPAPLTAFVGRATAVEQVAQAVAAHRLVTLHGPAGVGKSRLAMEVARATRRRFPDGVWWVDLTVARDQRSVLQRLSETLTAVAAPGVAADEALSRTLEHRELLLVLDNCEHVVDALAPLLVAWLERAARVRALATSRLLLGIAGESCWEVPPLHVPPSGATRDEVLASEAVMLFRQRCDRLTADPTQESLDDVGRLCRRLDGVPLALELAAAQTGRLGVHDLNDRLGAELFSAAQQVSGVTHHAGLGTTLDWSYSLLEQHCQHMFDWLSVFPGDFDADAGVALAAAAPGMTAGVGRRCLADLVDASLVQARVGPDQTRYRLLFVMREYATSRLAERGESDAAWQAFTEHFRQRAAEAGRGLNGAHSGLWLARVQRELVNLRAAATWSAAREPPEMSLPFVRALGRVNWSLPAETASDQAELRSIVQRADDTGADPRELGWAWQELVTSAYLSGHVGFALRACDRAEELFGRSGDSAGIAAVFYHRGAAHLLATGDLAQAEHLLRDGRALARETGLVATEAWCCAHLTQLHSFASTVSDETIEALARATRIADPRDHQLQAHLGMDRALIRLAQSDPMQCMADARACERYSHEHDNTSMEQAAMVARSTALLLLGRFDEAQPLLLRGAQLMLDLQNSMQLGLSLQALARVADHEGDAVRAARLWGAATARTPVWPLFQEVFDPADARRALGARFEVEVAHGSTLDNSQALSLAVG